MDCECQEIFVLKNKNTFRITNSAVENVRENPVGQLTKLNVHTCVVYNGKFFEIL